MARFDWKIIFAFVFLFVAVTGYRHYQEQLPNGDRVPHPCKPNYIWRGVGHSNPLGGGIRNPFGIDFEKYHKWTEELCRKDSDGDGMMNGQELGDPECKWKPGDTPSRYKDVTHPGICDPWGDEKCKKSNERVSCDTGEFKCEAINAPDVRNYTVRFPKTRVPAQETTYYCMTFDLPDDQLYHLIATKPYIDNADVMHHIVVQVCNDDVALTEKPGVCYMSQAGCGDGIGGWTVGSPGECLYRETGVKIGISGRKRISVQFHWTNPELKEDYFDSSGITFFYTPKLRKYNAAIFSTGEMYLNIPPGEPRVTVKSTCKKHCTKKVLKGPIYLTSGGNHMHYLGYQQSADLYRGGKRIMSLTNDKVYSYDSPVQYRYVKPVEVRPGDEIVTTCTFRSVSRRRTVTFGEGSYDEMCFSFFNIFPAENLKSAMCLTYGDVDYCEFSGGSIRGCESNNFWNSTHPKTKSVFKKISDNCNTNGECLKECPAAVAEVRKHPCLQGDLELFHLNRFAKSNNVNLVKFAAALTSCDPRFMVEPTDGSPRQAASFLAMSIIVLVITQLYQM